MVGPEQVSKPTQDTDTNNNNTVIKITNKDSMRESLHIRFEVISLELQGHKHTG